MSAITLQSDDHRRLLDIVDKLRSRGISQYVDLPEIVVCGDQSAGKSSVLEAISGMSFPVKDNLCTRFATELIIRRARDVDVKTSIIPGLDTAESERARIASVEFQTSGEQVNISDVVDKAKTAMGLSEGRTFSSDTLRIEISGPYQPNLIWVRPGVLRSDCLKSPLVVHFVQVSTWYRKQSPFWCTVFRQCKALLKRKMRSLGSEFFHLSSWKGNFWRVVRGEQEGGIHYRKKSHKAQHPTSVTSRSARS